MDRCHFFNASGIVLSLSLVGCFGSDESPGDTGDGSNDLENDGDGSEGTQAATRSLFVENLDHETRRAELDVVSKECDAVIEGTYEIPDVRGIEFRQEVTWSEEFEVTTTLESDLSETFVWEIASCPGPEAEEGGSELPGGSRNGSVRIEPGAEELSFGTDSCDEIIAGSEVAIGPAENYEVESSN